MNELTKSEYKLLLCLYKINKAVSKHELLMCMPNLSPNTANTLLKQLLLKGYIEIVSILQTRTSLARVYAPCIPFSEFLMINYGFNAIKLLINKSIMEIEDTKILEDFKKRILIRKISLKNSIIQDE